MRALSLSLHVPAHAHAFTASFDNNSGLGQETLNFEGVVERIFTCWSNMNSNNLKRMVSLPIHGWKHNVVLIQELFLSNMSSGSTQYRMSSKQVIESKQNLI